MVVPATVLHLRLQLQRNEKEIDLSAILGVSNLRPHGNSRVHRDSHLIRRSKNRDRERKRVTIITVQVKGTFDIRQER